MQSTNIPTKIPIPFANSASSTYKTTIPQASQIGIANGRASLTDGFPPLTFQGISSGGIPPFGADFNGILYEITSITQWQQAGGMFLYDSSFSTTISGYPRGSVLQSSSLNGLWISSAENNTTNPDTGGAGWISLAFEGSQSISVTSADVTLTQLQSAYPILIISGALTAARNLIFPAVIGEWIVQNNTTGAFTLTAKTASGTGVTLTQGQSTYFYGDGTNIYFADSAKVASFNGRVGTVTLNATDVTTALGYTPLNKAGDTMSGALTNSSGFIGPLTGSATMTTGPLRLSSCGGAANSEYWIGQGNAAGLTMAFYVPSGNGMEWGRANTSDLVMDTNGNFNFLRNLLLNGSNVVSAATIASYFPASLTGSGYQRLPNGWIVQWGTSGLLGKNAGVTISLPISFPAAFSVLLTSPVVSLATENGQSSSGNVVNLSTLSVSNTASVSVSFSVFWVAIGW